MAKTKWSRTLEEVLSQKTEQKVFISEKTGNEYVVDVIPILNVLSIGSYEVVDDGYKYSIVDTTNDLEYTIKTSNLVEVTFGTVLQFKNVRGGSTANGIGWYKADSVSVVKRHEA